ncbi:hypothetical protein D3C87_1654490 [compost metagenome]
MGDENHCQSLGPQVPNDVEQALHLVAVEAGGRLIENEHLARQLDCAGNGNDLLHSYRMCAQFARWVDVQPVALENAAGVGFHLATVDQAKPGRLMPEKEVFRNRAVGQQVDLLIDGADAVGLGLLGIVQMYRFPIGEHRAAVGLIGARQNLDQGGFSGPVLA